MNKMKRIAALGLAGCMLLQFSLLAGSSENKSVEKAKAAVENGAPDDWQLLAKQAKVLLRKKKDLATAKEWIEKSMAIKSDVINLELMGDYYALNNLAKEAMDYYSQCSKRLVQENPQADISRYQNKIWSLKH